MTLLSLLIVTLGICHRVVAWGLLVPIHILERGRVQVEITNNDGGGYNWPYEFEVWKNVSGKADERIYLQDVRATPIYWDNNQPVGTFIRFRFQDVNNFVFGSEFIRVKPNPTTLISGATTMPTATTTSFNTTTVWASTTEMASAAASSGPPSLNLKIAAIAGGVVGGVLLLAVVTTALMLFLRRAPKNRKEKSYESTNIRRSTPALSRYWTCSTYSSLSTHSI
ncbi:hypothetical protein ACGC1H_007494 [Rhizoctonia solani]